MNYSKYGLSEVKADGSDYDKGIVSDGRGGYVKIDGFSREQNDDLDTDQGAVFKSDLYEDSGADFSSFNTAKDVEGALIQLAGQSKKEYGQEFDNSPKVAQAKARLAEWKEDVISGKTGTDLWQKSKTGGKDAANSFLQRYKIKLGKPDEDSNSFQPEETV